MSVIGIEGASCGVDAIGAAAIATGGSVNLVNPLELQRQMRLIIDNPPVGLRVKLELQSSSSVAFTTHYGMAASTNQLKNSFIVVIMLLKLICFAFH